ncbi:MAG: CoA transferase [Gammaproteobacteria bacterium]|jgi:crotonobetainyl-CoA:carnitine CoA-transferase CaiB-like acyl-CoA transferase|nr:CoA transferase [Gammaproteobacteria bacterium]MBT6073676.1 CoA transferase [Gammaproteobacteria bacterium]MDG2435192.1 CaiB/BaiF CoA-transferase family protein [Gammaproteobacteria bacterium]
MPALDNIKILDFTTLLPGPYATMTLADMGADVLWVETVSEGSASFEHGGAAMRSYLGRSKRSISINLKDPKGKEVIETLINDYDILVEQFRPGVMERLGLSYQELSQLNSKLIYCSITGYGQTGPLKQKAGHDINYLSLSGVSSYSGLKKEGPTLSGVQIADLAGGSMQAVTGILAAIIERTDHGVGQHIDISMLDGSFAMNSIHAADYLVNSSEASFQSNSLNGGSFYNYYKTKDNKYISVGSLEPKFFKEVCERLDRMDLYNINYLTPEAQETISQGFTTVFGKMTQDECVVLFADSDACVEPVLSLSEAIESEQLENRAMVVSVPDRKKSIERQVGSPIKFSNSEPVYKHTAPAKGGDTIAVLQEMGYNKNKIEQLIQQKIVLQA